MAYFETHTYLDFMIIKFVEQIFQLESRISQLFENVLFLDLLLFVRQTRNEGSEIRLGELSKGSGGCVLLPHSDRGSLLKKIYCWKIFFENSLQKNDQVMKMLV